MNCPTCGNTMQTLQTRETKDGKATKRRKVCSLDHRFTSIETLIHTANAKWTGVWLTNYYNTFIVVPINKQPYLLLGEKALQPFKKTAVSISEDGHVSRGANPDIALVEKRRGDESFTSTGELWPIVKE